MAFSKKKVEDRKDWLRQYIPGTYLDSIAKEINYTDFVNKVSPLSEPSIACLTDLQVPC